MKRVLLVGLDPATVDFSDPALPPGMTAYGMSKAALNYLGAQLAVDLKQDGVAVGMFHPGWVRTKIGGPAGQLSPRESARGMIMSVPASSTMRS